VIWSIVVAAGRAERFGRLVPKQFETLAGRRVVDWSIASASEVSDGVVLVVPPGYADAESVQPGSDSGVPVRVVVGGETRSESVRHGLAAVPDEASIVVVHDAARPLARPELFRDVIRAVRDGAEGAVPGLALVDTVKRVEQPLSDENRPQVVETLDRSNLVRVQTPQAFAAASLRRAHDAGGDATDDAALVEALGGRVVVVAGDPENVKLTVLGDLSLAEAALAERGAL
jgi:2-C-methyl-D-erythritol 4-phosphate cytidylyltransferase